MLVENDRPDRGRKLSVWLTGCALIMTLGGCQQDAGLHTPSRGGGSLGASTPDYVSYSMDVLSAFFVRNFDAYEAEAARRRNSVARYTYQHNSWRLSGGDGTVYESYPLASSRFEYAHAAGLTGAGQLVSVVDSGFLVGHEVFSGKSIHVQSLGVPVDQHGTGVASVIAGNSSTMMGVAPGASLALGAYTSQARLAEATRDALNLGAVAQNNSWGYSLAANQTNFNSVFPSGSSYLTALTDYAAEGVVIFAASNDETRTTSTLMEALPALRPQLEPGWIAVVNAVPNYDADGVNSAVLLSSGCLDAARWCIAADGGWMSASSSSTSAYRFATGSSFATPQVAGAMALLAEAFPDLTPHDLRIRLLASADNSFFAHDGTVELVPGFSHGYALDYGHGFLDMRAALMPIGDPVVPLSDGGTLAADAPALVSGGALGDAVSRSLSAHDVLVTDTLGGAFHMAGDALVSVSLPPDLIGARLGQMSTGPAPAEYAAGDLFSTMSGGRAEFATADESFEVSLLATPGREDFGLGLSRVVSGDEGGEMSLGLSLMHDASGSLGLSGPDGGAGWAAAIDMRATLGSQGSSYLSLFGQMGVGEGGQSSFADVSGTRFSSVGIDMGRSDAFRQGDSIAFGISLPTALTSGSASMTLPVTRSAGVVSYDTVDVDLAPEDREVRLSLRYRAPIGRGWDFVAEGLHAVNRGHIRGLTETGAMLGVQARF